MPNEQIVNSIDKVKVNNVLYKVTDSEAARSSGVALVIDGTTYDADYTKGKYFWHNDILYKTSIDVTSGTTITPNTNCELASIGDDLNSGLNDIRVAQDDIDEMNNKITILENKTIDLASTKISNPPVIYCWGDSLTEGLSGNILPPDGFNAYPAFSYPAWVGQTYKTINLGTRGEASAQIMARQGADPIRIKTAFTIPASKDTPVLVEQMTNAYNIYEGAGLKSKGGLWLKMNRECESAGLNPCTIAGVEGILYREIGDEPLSNEGTYNLKFKRLNDGEAVTVPVGTIVQSFAMRHYRNNGAAVIWMGANDWRGYPYDSPYLGVDEYINRVDKMLEYGGYGNNFVLIISREYDGEDLEKIKQTYTDINGVCHVVSLMDELPVRGYQLAGIGYERVDTSSWTTTDPIMKNAPLLCEYLSGNPYGTSESDYGELHYSIWGNRAIGKLVTEKLAEVFGVYTDNYGVLRYKFVGPLTLDGSNYLDTRTKLYNDLSDSWTAVFKWHGTPVSFSNMYPYPATIFCDSRPKDDTDENDHERRGLDYFYYKVGEMVPPPDGIRIMLGSNDKFVGLNATSDNIVERYGYTNVVIIAKNKNSYRAYVNNTTPYSGTFALPSNNNNTLPLIVGGRYDAEGNVGMKTKFTIDQVMVYSGALSDEACVSLYNDLTT